MLDNILNDFNDLDTDFNKVYSDFLEEKDVNVADLCLAHERVAKLFSDIRRYGVSSGDIATLNKLGLCSAEEQYFTETRSMVGLDVALESEGGGILDAVVGVVIAAVAAVLAFIVVKVLGWLFGRSSKASTSFGGGGVSYSVRVNTGKTYTTSITDPSMLDRGWSAGAQSMARLIEEAPDVWLKGEAITSLISSTIECQDISDDTLADLLEGKPFKEQSSLTEINRAVAAKDVKSWLAELGRIKKDLDGIAGSTIGDDAVKKTDNLVTPLVSLLNLPQDLGKLPTVKQLTEINTLPTNDARKFYRYKYVAAAGNFPAWTDSRELGDISEFEKAKKELESSNKKLKEIGDDIRKGKLNYTEIYKILGLVAMDSVASAVDITKAKALIHSIMDILIRHHYIPFVNLFKAMATHVVIPLIRDRGDYIKYCVDIFDTGSDLVSDEVLGKVKAKVIKANTAGALGDIGPSIVDMIDSLKGMDMVDAVNTINKTVSGIKRKNTEVYAALLTAAPEWKDFMEQTETFATGIDSLVWVHYINKGKPKK